MADIRASIDIGSNSTLLLIAELVDGEIKVLESESRITALGYQLDINKEFHPDSMKSCYQALADYGDIVDSYKIDRSKVVITATEASRVARNAKDFYTKVLRELKLKVQTINAEGEAYYSARGILIDIQSDDETVFVLDIGGASSELISIDNKNKKVLSSFSLPFGAVRATNWKESQSVDEEFLEVKRAFSKNLDEIHTKKLFCVAGTMTSVANMLLGHREFEERKIHGHCLSVSQVEELKAKVELMTQDEILNHYPFLGKRSKTILGGLEVAMAVFSWLSVEALEVSTYGLRYGTLIEGQLKDIYLV